MQLLTVKFSIASLASSSLGTHIIFNNHLSDTLNIVYILHLISLRLLSYVPY
jgi:hypothetical protein